MRRALPWVGLGLLTVVAFVWRAHAAAAIEYPSVDGANYMTVARVLVRDGTLQFSTFPPGWSLCIALALVGAGSTDAAQVLAAAQSANVVFGTLAVPLVFLLLRHGFGAWIALGGAAVIALLPDNVILSSVDLSEMSYLCVFVAAWIAWHRGWWWACGALFGFAYLIRPEALIVLAAAVVVRSIADRRIAWRPVASAAPFVIAYVLFVHDATGQWTLSGKTAFLDHAAASGGHPVTRWFTNAGALLEDLAVLLGLPFVLAAAWGAVQRRGIELVAFVPMLLLPVFTFAMDPRYWIPLVPFVIWYAAAGVIDLTGRLRSATARRAVTVGAVVLLAGGAAWAGRPDLREIGRNHEAFSGLREAGRWIAENSEPDDVVVGYKPYAAFWAGRPYAKLPRRDDTLATVDRIRESGHDLLVVNVTLARSVAPQLEPLLRPLELDERYARRMRLVHVVRIEGDPRQTTAIYRILPLGG